MTDCSTRYSKSPQFDTIHQTFLLRSMLRFPRVTLRIFLGLWLSLLLALSPLAARAADGIEFTQASLETTDDGYRLTTAFSFELTRALEDALMRGVPLYFTTQVEISRPRWYWFDDTAVSATRSVRISYNLLTRQYRASIDGNLHRNFTRLEDMLALLQRPGRWIIADLSTLNTGVAYNVSVQMGLDVAQLPKPIQVSAIASGDWKLSTGWKHFSFRAESN